MRLWKLFRENTKTFLNVTFGMNPDSVDQMLSGMLGKCGSLIAGMLSSVFPIWVPRLAIQALAGPLGGMTTALFTNPLDTVRARIQVKPFLSPLLARI